MQHQLYTGGRDQALIQLFQQTFTDSEGADEGKLIGELVRKFRATTSPQDLRVFITTDETAIIGCVIFSKMRFEHSSDQQVWLLSPAAVHTQYQGKGVGQGLIHYAHTLLKCEGVAVVVTYGDINFYSKVGYQPITTAMITPPISTDLSRRLDCTIAARRSIGTDTRNCTLRSSNQRSSVLVKLCLQLFAIYKKDSSDFLLPYTKKKNKMNINLETLGFHPQLQEYREAQQLTAFLIGRVSSAHKERYTVLTDQGEFTAELLGNLRFTAQNSSDFPVVGDWVALAPYDTNKGLIHAIYPRRTLLERQAVGKTGEKQLIAANIDYGLIVQSLNRDFSMNRLERYLTICHASHIQPMILLTKIDLVEEALVMNSLQQLRERIPNVPIIPISNATGEGLADFQQLVKTGMTYCLLGSSGVGKSTLINRLTGNEVMHTGAISKSIDRGKHVTTHRELIVLDTGGILIDNPGMREVGIADSASGLAVTFEQIYALAAQCKFKDCTHVNEKGCAILAALDDGTLDEQTYQHYLKLEREQEHYSSTVHERRKKEKRFGKMVKRAVAQKKWNKY